MDLSFTFIRKERSISSTMKANLLSESKDQGIPLTLLRQSQTQIRTLLKEDHQLPEMMTTMIRMMMKAMMTRLMVTRLMVTRLMMTRLMMTRLTMTRLMVTRLTMTRLTMTRLIAVMMDMAGLSGYTIQKEKLQLILPPLVRVMW